MKVTKVLVVDDFPAFQRMFTDLVKGIFGEGVIVLVASTLDEATKLFEENKSELDLILLDTSLGDGVYTYQLAKTMRKVFSRPIVGTSTDEKHRELMVKFGCTHSCNKTEVGDLLKKWK